MLDQGLRHLDHMSSVGTSPGGVLVFASAVVLLSLCISIAACKFFSRGGSSEGVEPQDCPDCEAARTASLRATHVQMWVPSDGIRLPTPNTLPAKGSKRRTCQPATKMYTAVATSEESVLADSWSESCIEETTDEIFV